MGEAAGVKPLNWLVRNWTPSVVAGAERLPDPPPLPRPLFRPLGEWHVSPRPGLAASDYERRKTMRELEMAFTTRATALHRHRFD